MSVKNRAGAAGGAVGVPPICVGVGFLAPNGQMVIPMQMAEQSVVAADLPSADPHQKGQLWSSAGVITISAG
jgi:hypothetical protein